MIPMSRRRLVTVITETGERREGPPQEPPEGYATLVAPRELVDVIVDLLEVSHSGDPQSKGIVMGTVANALRLRQGEDDRFERLIAAMMPEGVTPRPVAAQAQRNAALRTKALEEIEMLDSDDVAQVTGSLARNRAAAASRLARSGRVLFVEHEGRRLFPAFQFDFEAGTVRQESVQVVRTLADRGVHGWAGVLWMNRPNGWLAGARPVEILTTEPERVLAAAEDIGVAGG
jgi:hypothetical protein